MGSKHQRLDHSEIKTVGVATYFDIKKTKEVTFDHWRSVTIARIAMNEHLYNAAHSFMKDEKRRNLFNKELLKVWEAI